MSKKKEKGLARKNGLFLIGGWYKFIYVIAQNVMDKP